MHEFFYRNMHCHIRTKINKKRDGEQKKQKSTGDYDNKISSKEMGKLEN